MGAALSLGAALGAALGMAAGLGAALGAVLGAALGTGAALGAALAMGAAMGAALVMAAALGLGGGSVLALAFAFFLWEISPSWAGRGSLGDHFFALRQGQHGRLGLVLAAWGPASWPCACFIGFLIGNIF